LGAPNPAASTLRTSRLGGACDVAKSPSAAPKRFLRYRAATDGAALQCTRGTRPYFLCFEPGARFFAPPWGVCSRPGARFVAPPGVVCCCPGVLSDRPGAVPDFPLVCAIAAMDVLRIVVRARTAINFMAIGSILAVGPATVPEALRK